MTRKFPIKGLAPPLCLTALVLTGCGAHLDAASAPSETTAAAAPAAAIPATSALPPEPPTRQEGRDHRRPG